MWLLLPLKDFVKAKQRLSGCLSVAERRALFQHMVEDVMAVLSTLPENRRLILVSDDPAAHLLAEHFAADCWPESELGSGLNAVLEAALTRIASRADAPSRVMIVHGDLPLLNISELQQLCALQGYADDAVAIATDRHGSGSNAVLMPLQRRIPLRYGENSLDAHRQEAEYAGLHFFVQQSSCLAQDIDTRDDLLTLVSQRDRECAPQTMAYLHRSGIARRLRQMNTEPNLLNREQQGS